jgi:hypothetical protein
MRYKAGGTTSAGRGLSPALLKFCNICGLKPRPPRVSVGESIKSFMDLTAIFK